MFVTQTVQSFAGIGKRPGLFRVFFAQALKCAMVDARPATELMLDHVDVAIDLVFQRAVAGRMTPGGPERAGDGAAIATGGPPEGAQFSRIAGRRKLPDFGSMAFLKVLVQQLGEAAAAVAVPDRSGVQDEIRGVAREFHDLGHQGAQLLNIEAGADDGAMAFVRDFPQLSPAGACGGGCGKP